MPATPRIRMVYKNRGLVKKGCCVVQPIASCVPPTAGALVVFSPPDLGENIVNVTVAYTGASSFQWWYTSNTFDGPVDIPFVDGGTIAGSMTPTLTVKISLDAVFVSIYCIVTNECGSATSSSVLLGIIQSGGHGGNQ